MSHGHKTQNPGWQSGNYWVVCDRCGKDYRVANVEEEWNGLVVCTSCFETRHPQDFVRSVKDDSSPTSYVRTEPVDGVADERADDGTTVVYAEAKESLPSGNDFGNGDTL